MSRPEFLLDLVEPVEERDADADEDLLLRDLDSLGVPLLFQAWVGKRRSKYIQVYFCFVLLRTNQQMT